MSARKKKPTPNKDVINLENNWSATKAFAESCKKYYDEFMLKLLFGAP